MLEEKLANFPLKQNHNLALYTSPLLQDPTPYMRLLGRFIYLVVTRLDLTYLVHVIAQFMQEEVIIGWQHCV